MLADECHKPGHQALLLLFPARLAQPRLLSRAGATGHDGRAARERRLGPLSRLHGRPAHELLTHYGEIGGIWFDGWWDKPRRRLAARRTYGLIHRLQPAALVGSNHHVKPIPRRGLPDVREGPARGQDHRVQPEPGSRQDLPLETCETMNNSWGFNITDKHYKSTKELVQYLVRAAGHDANFLLNVGPMPNGRSSRSSCERLRRGGAVDVALRRVHLRHAGRADPAAALGGDDAKGRQASTSTSSTGPTRRWRFRRSPAPSAPPPI